MISLPEGWADEKLKKGENPTIRKMLKIPVGLIFESSSILIFDV